MFKKYTDYLKDNPNHYWFKRKLYGWGWTPATWQGWLVTLVYVLLIGASTFILQGKTTTDTVVFIITFVVLLGAFVFVAYKTGEKPCWQWGNKINSK